ncbi:single-stranded DNA-binding protein [Planococcus sp. APC 4015]|nr:single-stranded DNA-binding protein [Planococcus sp. APC 4015]
MNETMITVTGNVATPPELKLTPAGVSLTKFRVASTERRWDRETSSWIDGHTNWYSVTLFRGLADHAYRSISKGDRVILSGTVRVKAWDNGVKQGADAEIEADAIGHDLRWGTTTFTKSARPTAAAEPSTDDGWATRAEPEAAAAPVDASSLTEWATPGETADSELAGVAPF